MAEAAITVDDDSVVELEVDEGVDLVALGLAPAAGTPATPPAVTLGDGGTPAATPPSAVDEATKVLNQSLEQARQRERAALATADAERRRAEAERVRADTATREAADAKTQVEATQLAAINQGIEAATSELASAKAEFKAAHEAGDSDRMADAQIKIGGAAAALDRLKADKNAFEVAATRRAAEPPPTPPAPADTSAPQDRFINQYIRSPVAQAWLRAHPECVPANFGGDSVKNAQMMLAHEEAKRQGITLDSPQYYEHLETKLGYRTPTSAAAEVTPAVGPTPPAARPATPRTPMPAAPPSREPPTASGKPTGKQSVQLSKDQQEHALLSTSPKPGETEQAYRVRAFREYAEGLVYATKEGKIGRVGY